MQDVAPELEAALWAACAFGASAQVAATAPSLPAGWHGLLAQQPDAGKLGKQQAAGATGTAAAAGSGSPTHVVLLPAQSTALAQAHVQGVLAWEDVLDRKHPAAAWALDLGALRAVFRIFVIERGLPAG